MEVLEPNVSERRTIGSEFVGGDRRRDSALFLEYAADQFESGALAATRLHEDVENFSLGIDGAPQVHSSTADGHEHLIQVPSVVRSRSLHTKALCVRGPKSRDPATNRLVTHADTTFGH